MDDLGATGSGFTTTSFGIRTNGFRREPSFPVGAVVAVGDSFTAGSGLRDEESWPAQLEVLTQRPVINGSSGAWGVDQIVLRSEQLAQISPPSHLIVGILAQDSFRNSYDVFGGGFKPWFEVVNGAPVLKGVPVPRFEEKPIRLGWGREVLGHSWSAHWIMARVGLLHLWVSNSGRYRRVMSEAAGVEVSCALMQRLEELKSRYHSEVIVVLLWGAAEAREAVPPPYGSRVLECARQAGFQVLDLHPVLHEIAEQEPTRFEALWLNEGGVLGHPSVAGQALTLGDHLKTGQS